MFIDEAFYTQAYFLGKIIWNGSIILLNLTSQGNGSNGGKAYSGVIIYYLTHYKKLFHRYLLPFGFSLGNFQNLCGFYSQSLAVGQWLWLSW